MRSDETKQQYLLLSLLFGIVLEILVFSNRNKKTQQINEVQKMGKGKFITYRRYTEMNDCLKNLI